MFVKLQNQKNYCQNMKYDAMEILNFFFLKFILRFGTKLRSSIYLSSCMMYNMS